MLLAIMPSYCIVKGCNSKTYVLKNRENPPNVSFFRIPTKQDIREKWAETLKMNGQKTPLPKSGRICALHFSTQSFIQSGFRNKRLKPDAIPCILPNCSTQSNKLDTHISIPITTDIHEQDIAFISQEEITITDKPSINETLHIMSTKNEMGDCIVREEVRKSQTKTSVLLRYPGDITDEKIKQMTPQTVKKTLTVLKNIIRQKNNLIKRLRNTQIRQKKKIESMKILLDELKKNNLISTNTHNILQISIQKLFSSSYLIP